MSLAIIVVVSGWIVKGLGTWLVVADFMDNADAIVVLSGDVPYRAIEATRAYHEGWSNEVWLTREKSGAPLMADMGIEFLVSADYNLQILEELGVPAGAVTVIPTLMGSTADEVRAVGHRLAEVGGTRAIIVTSPAHARRTRTLWRRIVGDNAEVLVRPASGVPFSPMHWWRSSTDISTVAHELLGLVNAWTGSRIGPR